MTRHAPGRRARPHAKPTSLRQTTNFVGSRFPREHDSPGLQLLLLCRQEAPADKRLVPPGGLGNPHAGRFPYLEAELREAFPAGAVVDGEIVALARGPDGRAAQDFDRLGPIFAARPPPAPEGCGLYFVAFDLLELDGTDLRPRPWRERRAALEAALPERRGNVSVTPVTSCTREAHEQHLGAGFEGSVAKLSDGRYLGRHRTWVKIKARHQLDAKVLALSWGRDRDLHVLCAASDGQELGWAEAPSARLRAAAAAGRVMPGSLVTIAFSNWTARGRLREARVVASRSL